MEFGNFYILARSDPRKFKGKGGCSFGEDEFYGYNDKCESEKQKFKLIWSCKYWGCSNNKRK